MSENKFYQVFMFAIEEHAEIFRNEFGDERMHPSTLTLVSLRLQVRWASFWVASVARPSYPK